MRRSEADRRRLATAAILLLLGASGCGEQPVRLSIAAPADAQRVRTSSVRVHGTVAPPDAKVRVDDRAVPVRGGAFAVTVRLHRGRNRINVAANSSGRPPDIRDLVVTRGRTRTEIDAARRRRAARRAAAAQSRAERVAGGGGGRYPALLREDFLANCQVRGAAAACRCLLAYLEDHVSLSSLERVELELVLRGKIPKVLTDAASACRTALR